MLYIDCLIPAKFAIGDTVTKKNGTVEYKVLDKLTIYGGEGQETKEVFAPKGYLFLSNSCQYQIGKFNLMEEDTKVMVNLDQDGVRMVFRQMDEEYQREQEMEDNK